jgi:hypothetical protein
VSGRVVAVGVACGLAIGTAAAGAVLHGINVLTVCGLLVALFSVGWGWALLFWRRSRP